MKKLTELDFSEFPPGTITEYTTLVCLACIFDIFTKQIGLAPRSAYSEIKRYSPTVEELTSPKAVRPFFDSDEKRPRCPYCDAAKRWHARLDTYCIEGGKTTDAPRRKLFKLLEMKKEQFVIVEQKSDRRTAFFNWLDTLRLSIDLEDSAWLFAAIKSFLERKAPKEDWASVFAGLSAVRRSSRLTEGWEREGARLYLAPALYDESFLVQYLVSRSYAHGGLTSEGRLTLLEFLRRMRKRGYLSAHSIEGADQYELFEKLIEEVAGSGGVKLYYLVDRREFLDKVKAVYAAYA